ncbi:gliding motility lipoprotein GldH [Barnesiella viscericola]|uniref:gliding motility lipoprotein GldH n=1 Tax=Barnesiella viscericola TaxID=397865 RepID=UPI0023573B6B|nr:gliding motility lipoprotein GldH [Barnesiella viscericola]
MKKTGLLIGLAVVGLGSLCSCRQTDVYNEFNTLPRNGWFKRDVQRFTPESPDSTGRYDLYLTLRHNGDYAYRNLWLFVSYTGADGVQKTDTVNCELADEFGRWSGGGWGSYYQQELLLDDCFRFVGKEQVVTIQQAMRDDRIRGISDVGIRIAPHTEP